MVLRSKEQTLYTDDTEVTDTIDDIQLLIFWKYLEDLQKSSRYKSLATSLSALYYPHFMFDVNK